MLWCAAESGDASMVDLLLQYTDVSLDATALNTGEAVQVELMKSKLNARGTKTLETKLRPSAFKFWFQFQPAPLHAGSTLLHVASENGSVEVARCRWTLSTPR
jgi:hypothetical protein